MKGERSLTPRHHACPSGGEYGTGVGRPQKMYPSWRSASCPCKASPLVVVSENVHLVCEFGWDLLHLFTSFYIFSNTLKCLQQRGPWQSMISPCHLGCKSQSTTFHVWNAYRIVTSWRRKGEDGIVPFIEMKNAGCLKVFPNCTDSNQWKLWGGVGLPRLAHSLLETNVTALLILELLESILRWYQWLSYITTQEKLLLAVFSKQKLSISLGSNLSR